MVVKELDALGTEARDAVISTGRRDLALSLSADGIEPVSSRASIFSAIVLPTPDKLLDAALAAPSPPPRRRPRGSPSRRCGRPPRGRPPRRPARTGSPAPRRPPLSRRCASVARVRGLPGAWLILPTYNEAENIESFVRAVTGQLETVGTPYTVLIVDDGSPDGTGHIADRLAGELPHLQVLHRPRKPAWVARTWPASGWPRGRRRADARDGLRLLARPRRSSPPDRGLECGRPRARLPLRAGRRGQDWGLVRRRSRAAAPPTPACCSGCRCAT